MKNFLTCICSILLSTNLLFAQDSIAVVSDDALEGWLQQYASMMSDTTHMSNNSAQTDSMARERASEIIAEPSATPVVAQQTSQNKSQTALTQPQELLSTADSLELRKRAILESVYNPLFLDWVFVSDSLQTASSETAPDSTIKALRSQAKAFVFESAPELFTFHSDDLPDATDLLTNQLANNKKDALRMTTDEVSVDTNEKITIKNTDHNYWTSGAQFSVQASQLYISPNWYNGGESNLNSLINIKGFVKYDDKKRVQWENTAELKAGFISAGNDSLRMFRVNDDMLKLNTKLGVKAFGTFFYTAEAEMQTQLFNTFVPNTYERTTAAFSPIRFYLSIGMDYKYKDVLSVFVSPVSYKLVYVADTTVLRNTTPPVDPANNIAAKVGIEPGNKSLNQVGGLVRIGYKYKLNDDIHFETKLSFYANYVGEKKGVEIDWEVIANFIINRFLSARVSLNPRYDTTIKLPDGEKNKLQFKELVSFGFNYNIQ